MPFSSGSGQRGSTAQSKVVLDVEHDRILKLNPVGTDIWTLLAKGYDQNAIVIEISKQYGVPQGRVSQDVMHFMARIQTLRVTPSPDIEFSRQPRDGQCFPSESMRPS